jgi:hypothetical protein
MTTSDSSEKKPLWLLIEEKISGLETQDLSGENLEASIQRIAGELDTAGCNVSGHGGRMLQLRWAMTDAHKAGRPMLKDLRTAIAALTLEDTADPYSAADRIIRDIAKTWPLINRSERRADVIAMVAQAKLDLLIARAKGLPDDDGIRFLINENVAPEEITRSLDITAEKLKQVNAEMEKERAEKARVASLIEAAAGKSDEEKIKHLLDNNVSEKLIIEMAGIDQSAINLVKQAMEAELKEKQRLAEEEAARKKEAAAGPTLEAIAPDQMLEYIESIREILEFSDVEKEIRVMCEQSAIPKALVDIAVSDPAKLDELEQKAQG